MFIIELTKHDFHLLSVLQFLHIFKGIYGKLLLFFDFIVRAVENLFFNPKSQSALSSREIEVILSRQLADS